MTMKLGRGRGERMSISIEEVEHVAQLARLKLSDEEKQMFAEQLSKILKYVNKLNELDTEGVEPMSRASHMENVLREDEVKPSLARELVMKNAPDEQDGFFRVPSVLD